ncbi:pyridine nucleotide-disulfide oxidoreductase [Colletotrichum tofieldiae]|nr:pyridine nucleotide-disulfide oxidoreductase [Colletotrichum tofieldiae]
MNSFNPNHPTRFQKVTQDFLTAAIKAGKTKLVVEFQQNTGGLILPAYDFFRQLFPNTVQDGYSRFKENDAFVTTAKIVLDLAANFNPYISNNTDLGGLVES